MPGTAAGGVGVGEGRSGRIKRSAAETFVFEVHVTRDPLSAGL